MYAAVAICGARSVCASENTYKDIKTKSSIVGIAANIITIIESKNSQVCSPCAYGIVGLKKGTTSIPNQLVESLSWIYIGCMSLILHIIHKACQQLFFSSVHIHTPQAAVIL